MLAKEENFFDKGEDVMKKNIEGVNVYDGAAKGVGIIAYGIVIIGMTAIGSVVISYLLGLFAVWLNPAGLDPAVEDVINILTFCLSLALALSLTGIIYLDGKEDGILMAWKELARGVSFKDVPVEGGKEFDVAVVVKYKDGKLWGIELKSDVDKPA